MSEARDRRAHARRLIQEGLGRFWSALALEAKTVHHPPSVLEEAVRSALEPLTLRVVELEAELERKDDAKPHLEAEEWLGPLSDFGHALRVRGLGTRSLIEADWEGREDGLKVTLNFTPEMAGTRVFPFKGHVAWYEFVAFMRLLETRIEQHREGGKE